MLITIVRPLHRPGSAYAAASVCLQTSNVPTARDVGGRGVYRTRRPVGDRVPVAFPACVSTRVPVLETRPLPAVMCTHSPVTSTGCPAASDRGGRRFPSHYSSPVAPSTSPFCDVSGAPPFTVSIDRWDTGVSWKQRRGPAGDRPLLAPPQAMRLRSRW